ncbi:MAG: 3-hydroxybutyryl-CoA dehydrogenase [Gammaproteobacteria bacterium]|jgi:3-hydroxybutyryl-CoA dehydrogenase
MKNFATDKLTIGIIGAGIMGRGIAQIAALSGINVILYDIEQSACDDAINFIYKMLDRAVEKGKLEINNADVSKQNLSNTIEIKDLKNCDVIVEAIIENLDIKQSLFKDLECIVSPNCILTTNTSSLSVTSIASVCDYPDRVAGLHFFNPVPLMKLVEVIKGVRTADAVINALYSLVVRFGHSPVKVTDSPGFLVNHCGRGLITEGLRLLFENVTDPQTVDAVMRDCAGFRMGPFELMDLTGLDVTYPATEQIYLQYFNEARLKPTPLQKQRYTAGLYGRKTGEGFYRYKNNEKILTKESEIKPETSNSQFWLTSNCDHALRKKVIHLFVSAGCRLDESDKPESASIAVVIPLGIDVSTVALQEGLDPVRTIGIDSLFNFDKRIVLMTNPATSVDVINDATSMLSVTDKSISVIRDSAGFIAQRIIATIINISCDIAQQGIARPEDIDKSAKLGLGYPEGPLESGDRIGSDKILTILDNMQECYGDMRYRPSPWLRRRTQLGLSLLHVE